MNDKLTAVGVERLDNLLDEVRDELTNATSLQDNQAMRFFGPLLDALTELKRLRERSEKPVLWVPIGERLPSKDGTYPVTTESTLFTADIEARVFRNGVFLRPNMAEVTAWLDVRPYAAPSPVCAEPVPAEVIVEIKCKHDVALWARCTACEAESLSCQPAADAKVCDHMNCVVWASTGSPYCHCTKCGQQFEVKPLSEFALGKRP